MKPEFYIFVDERITPTDSFERYIVGSLIVAKQKWEKFHAETKRVAAMSRRKRLNSIKELLDQTGGFCLLTYADLPNELIASGEIDGTDDIPKMTRRDNAWMQSVSTLAAAALSLMRTSGVKVGLIDFFYDPKSLKAPHRTAFESLIRKTLTDITREDPIMHEIQAQPGLIFRKVLQVPKAYDDQPRVSQQDGIDVAHHLCTKFDEAINESSPRIVVRDHTNVLCKMIAKFETTEASDE
jgi:hypothetical protein